MARAADDELEVLDVDVRLPVAVAADRRALVLGLAVVLLLAAGLGGRQRVVSGRALGRVDPVVALTRAAQQVRGARVVRRDLGNATEVVDLATQLVQISVDGHETLQAADATYERTVGAPRWQQRHGVTPEVDPARLDQLEAILLPAADRVERLGVERTAGGAVRRYRIAADANTPVTDVLLDEHARLLRIERGTWRVEVGYQRLQPPLARPAAGDIDPPLPLTSIDGFFTR